MGHLFVNVNLSKAIINYTPVGLGERTTIQHNAQPHDFDKEVIYDENI